MLDSITQVEAQSRRRPIALSFDVEDWFTVRNMREFISEEDWEKQELRVDVGMDFILNSLAQKNIKATFFVLGWIADHCPSLIKRISDQGHEIGCHGYKHTPIDLMTPESFEVDLRKAIASIESITGKKVKGFRAPSFSITKKTAWALQVIKNCGLEYDSSIFSTIHPDYGVSDFPAQLTAVQGLIEVPLKKSKVLGTQLPVCGGGYFRMLPYSLTKHALNLDLQSDSVVMYFHPWEFDPEQPQMNLGLVKTFRHYVGLNANREKFLNLLNDFEFVTIENLIAATSQRRKLDEYFFNKTITTPVKSLVGQLT